MSYFWCGSASTLRRFAAMTLAVAVAIVAASPVSAAARKQDAGPIRFVFAADSHLGSAQGNKWIGPLVDDIMAEAARAPLAFIAFGGDMTEFGTREQYALYQESFARTGVPLYGVPGNHESKWGDAGKSGFRYALGPAFQSFDLSGVHFVFLDTSVDGETYGHLEPYMLDWLKEDLKRATGRPSVIFCHHPIGYATTRFLDNDDDFFEAVAGHDIAAVFTAHGHCTLKWKVNGIQFFMVPAAMDGRYMTASIQNGCLTVWDKAVGAGPVEVATIAIGRGGGAEPGLKTEARVAGGRIELKATAQGTGANAPAMYRVDLGPWNEMDPALEGAPNGVYSASIDAAPLDEGVHAVHVSVDAGENGVWTSRALVTIDRSPKKSTRVLWKYEGSGGIQGGLALTNNYLIAGSNDGRVTALRPADGRVIWRFKSNGAVTGQPVISGNYVYFGSASGLVYCLNLSSGTEKWHYAAESSVVGGVVVSGGRVFAATMLGSVHAIDAKSGKQVWEQRLGGPVRSTPAVAGPALYVGSWDGKVYRLATSSGKVEWASLIDASPYYAAATGRPLFFKDRVYVTSAQNPRNGNFGLRALDAATGTLVWSAAVPAAYSDPFVRGDMIAATTTGGQVWLVDPATGEVADKIVIGGSCLDSSAVPGPSGTLLIGTTDGQMRLAGGPESARKPLAVQMGDGFIFAKVQVSGDRAFVGTMDGRIYAISLRP